jgi:hypothetical protein
MPGLPGIDQATGQLTGYRTFLAGTAFNDEHTGHGLFSSGGDAMENRLSRKKTIK